MSHDQRCRRSARGRVAANVDLSVPVHFRCPISLDLMKDPVTLPTGITYDRQSIEAWVDGGDATCPVTGRPLAGRCEDLALPNHVLRKMIQDWCVANRSLGVDRIPTPKVPVTSPAVLTILSAMDAASASGDDVGCRKLAAKLKAIARESERNRRCVSSSGAGHALAKSFAAFAGPGVQCNAVLEEILSAATETFPLDAESRDRLSSRDSIDSMASILRHGSLAGRLTAVLTLREVRAGVTPTAGRTQGLVDGLARLIKEPVAPAATKSAMVVAFQMVSTPGSGAAVATNLAETGVVPPLLDLLVDSDDTSTCEKALGLLDALCTSEAGLDAVRRHALAVPVLAMRMFRVSDAAMGFAVSALWKICRTGEVGRLDEAFQVGLFPKLLLLLQAGCGERTKENANALLKLLNARCGTFECFDPVDLRGLRKGRN